mmetsp:Transcript_4818/g.12260  ORF Transcript_4818/g.12260 Transcript_4818/m.12260 type:complete len:150 (+) Transcript_4818:218-667(+)
MTAADMDDDIRAAARLTVIFCALYGATFANVLRVKKMLFRQAREAGRTFDRYTSLQMRVADRLQANLLEWSPIFLGLVWSLGVVGALDGGGVALWAAWIYLVLRALHVGLVLHKGVSSSGMNRHLWISTFPAYGCLVVMFISAISNLWF